MSSEISETRKRILKVTVDLLEEQHGHGIRMGDIAQRAGISRQAIYLHFASRTKLLDEATKYLDERLELDRRLAPSRSASSGLKRLRAYIEFWGYYAPEIYGAAKALLLVKETDEAAAAAWKNRMADMRDGCRAAIETLHSEGMLAPEWTPNNATDVLWTMLSIANWENLIAECGWSTEQYIDRMKTIAERILVKNLREH